MEDAPLRALIVDDEPVARRAVTMALTNEGFLCETAIDGNEAIYKVRDQNFDLVVTDLLMPNKHGHALAVDILSESTHRPLIVIHSNVDEPRLTKDLILRGVDDIIYKPTNYFAFAAKMKGLVCRRKRMVDEGSSPNSTNSNEFSAGALVHGAPVANSAAISLDEFDKRLGEISHILPVSNSALELLKCVRATQCDLRLVNQIVSNDAVLTAELLRLANSHAYNRTGRQFRELNEAIAHVGTKRLGDIAVAVCTLESMTDLVLPWLDKDLARRRSLATNLAIEAIFRNKTDTPHYDAVSFCALMHHLRHFVVATAYAPLYESLVAKCQTTSRSLNSLESETFPRQPAVATAIVLSHWGVPNELLLPLQYADLTFRSIATLPRTIKSSVLLMKSVVFFAEMALGNWMPWELIDFPSSQLLREINIHNPQAIIEEIRGRLESIREASCDAIADATAAIQKPNSSIPYYCWEKQDFDFLSEIISLIGVDVHHVEDVKQARNGKILVNCLHSSTSPPIAEWSLNAKEGWCMMCDQRPTDDWLPVGTTIPLPSSFRALEQAMERVLSI
ncbi:putative transcriptional regulatory protein TcrX [Pirellula sp. SH-Sr6A]|uniref:HDOD domain-containing protein n=1 Tax=Pirellula sp. SH-Sr6A TaxID=1632865 RepID=UPI00078DEC83|nr:HDOD domain-containing protein [Pirellula sp. SH-Sr6A]AMV31388.1 putative transcriptional regulatory protein TcrX [Pirellula sp. SH-Sr6A]